MAFAYSSIGRKLVLVLYTKWETLLATSRLHGKGLVNDS